MKKILIIALTALMASCNNSDDTPDVRNPSAPGFSYALSENSFEATSNSVRSALQSTQNITLVAEVDHRANARSVNSDLRNTKIFIFGNPALGTPLMQINQLAGLDLPQKLLVYQDSDGNVFTGFNSTAYLSARHNVGGANTIQQISTALTNFTANATGGIVAENATIGISNSQGVFTVISNNDFQITYTKLRNAIFDNPKLNLIREVDHQANAQSVNMTLRPTRLIIFGNPELGTPLMRSSQTTGIDLPQKFLVWQDADGSTKISYNSPDYLKLRHDISGNDDNISKIKAALADLALSASN